MQYKSALIYETTAKFNYAGPISGAKAQFMHNLRGLIGPTISLVNTYDDSVPPTDFAFINDCRSGKGVERVSEDFMVGCSCREDNGRHIGCEYRSCECLQDAVPDQNGNKHFPYHVGEYDKCLRPVYLKTRDHIYECNPKCNCKDNCKNKVVQWGRQVPLEIFKTLDRGWGKVQQCSFSALLIIS